MSSPLIHTEYNHFPQVYNMGRDLVSVTLHESVCGEEVVVELQRPQLEHLLLELRAAYFAMTGKGIAGF